MGQSQCCSWRSSDVHKDPIQIPPIKLEKIEHLNYKKEDKIIGKGPIGIVQSCLDMDNGSMYAVKTIKIKGDLVEIKDQVERLKRRIHLQQRNFKHDNVIKYLDCVVKANERSLEIVQELASDSLKSIIQTFGPQNERVIQQYIRKVLTGLEHLHLHQFMHQNLKSTNVLVDSDGKIKLTDIGIFNESFIEQSEEKVQAPYWTAPEVIKSQGTYSVKSDIWSVGCLIIEMFTGIPPWQEQSDDPTKVAELITSQNPKIPEKCSDTLKEFLVGLLLQDPEERPTATEALQHKFMEQDDHDETFETLTSQLFTSNYSIILKESSMKLPSIQRSNHFTSSLKFSTTDIKKKEDENLKGSEGFSEIQNSNSSGGQGIPESDRIPIDTQSLEIVKASLASRKAEMVKSHLKKKGIGLHLNTKQEQQQQEGQSNMAQSHFVNGTSNSSSGDSSQKGSMSQSNTAIKEESEALEQTPGAKQIKIKQIYDFDEIEDDEAKNQEVTKQLSNSQEQLDIEKLMMEQLESSVKKSSKITKPSIDQKSLEGISSMTVSRYVTRPEIKPVKDGN